MVSGEGEKGEEVMVLLPDDGAWPAFAWDWCLGLMLLIA